MIIYKNTNAYYFGNMEQTTQERKKKMGYKNELAKILILKYSTHIHFHDNIYCIQHIHFNTTYNISMTIF